ncbi:hypothetical protein VU01_14021 [Candidatus Electrothrix marina]|uniref:Uncharacterized protein n=1 Tax=Candidatus Electrothrix marina TaxID=1859130 RepID=A0A444JAB8_9BACT|nr:hypothetical protein VU01_14021 [Candidatus Electrothrix marina]
MRELLLKGGSHVRVCPDYEQVQESGQFFRSTMIDTDSRLRAARGFGKIETESSAAVFRQLKD